MARTWLTTAARQPLGRLPRDDDVHRARAGLRVRVIHRDARVALVERVLLDAPDHPDDGQPRRIGIGIHAAAPQPLADRILARPQHLRHVVVDDHDARRLARVVLA